MTPEQERLRYLRLKAKAASAAAPSPPEQPRAPNALPKTTPEGAFTRGLANTFGTGNAIGAAGQTLGLAAGDVLEMLHGRQSLGEYQDNLKSNFKSAYRGNQQETKADKEQQLPASLAGSLTGGLLTGPTLGVNTLRGMMSLNGILGAVGGAASSDSDTALGRLGDTSLAALAGIGSGALGYGVGKGIGAGFNWLAGKAGERAARAATQIEDLAKASAGEATASARSAAGTSATAAYKNATNIEEALKAGAMTLEDLTPEQLTLYRGLLRERAQKAAEGIASDATRKSTKGAEYAEALASEPQRVAEAAKRIGDPMSQVGPRAKRYVAPLAGKIAGGLLGYELGEGDPMWALLGMGIGGAAGGSSRPMQHAITRMVQHPSFQRPIWNTLANLARGSSPIAELATPISGSAGRALGLDADSLLLPLLARKKDDQSNGSLATMMPPKPIR